MHNRRARSTIRLLKEDLTAGWESPQPARSLAEGAYDSLHPLSELPHPIIAKASESFGPQVEQDSYIGPILSSKRLRLLEIKTSQWRGGIWADPATGVNWLVVAGLAKGEHRDHDDFYKRVQRENDGGDPSLWLPTAQDQLLLKRETAARLMTQWELDVQALTLEALRSVCAGGTARFIVHHPIPAEGVVAEVNLDVAQVREVGYDADEIGVEILPASKHATSNLAWQLTIRVVISLHPPEQGWDRLRNTFSNIAEPGSWVKRVSELESLMTEHELARSEPGRQGHYTHRSHLAGRTIEGRGVRALCGTFFVPTQDHEALPRCATCEDRLAELPS